VRAAGIKVAPASEEQSEVRRADRREHQGHFYNDNLALIDKRALVVSTQL